MKQVQRCSMTLVVALALVVFDTAGRAAAQGLPGSPLALAHGEARDGSAQYRDAPVSAEGRYVVISLAEHRLYLMEQERVIWSALVGTGTGTRLEGAGQKWEFSTPRGMFRIQRKEKDPVWVLADWVFVERGSRSRRPIRPSATRRGCSAPQRSTSARGLPCTAPTTPPPWASPSRTAVSA